MKGRKWRGWTAPRALEADDGRNLAPGSSAASDRARSPRSRSVGGLLRRDRGLRSRGLRGVLSPLGKSVFHIVNEAEPRAVVLRAGVPSWLDLLVFLGRRGVATIVIGTPRQLRAAGESGAEPIGVLHPTEPIEIAETVELVVGSRSADLPDTIDLGNLVIDVRGRAAVMDGRDLRLPPKEFDILVQLALRAGEPIASIDLVRKVWPDNPRASIDDLHCRVKMLRDALGDRDPANRLLENRRG